MIIDICNNLLKDQSIKKIYDEIGDIEDKEKGWVYHNFDHILNVTDIVTKVLYSLGYEEEFIAKAEIACLFHDVGALQGKENHAERSYEFAKKYFKENNISFNGIDDILDAIRIHSDGFETDNVVALSLILADKLDIKKTRIAKEGKNVIGNRQYSHIEDIDINIKNNNLTINFITDDEIDIDELNEYYFTKKVFKAINSFCKKINLDYKVFMNNKIWSIDF